jgi:hypothetical protein
MWNLSWSDRSGKEGINTRTTEVSSSSYVFMSLPGICAVASLPRRKIGRFLGHVTSALCSTALLQRGCPMPTKWARGDLRHWPMAWQTISANTTCMCCPKPQAKSASAFKGYKKSRLEAGAAEDPSPGLTASESMSDIVAKKSPGVVIRASNEARKVRHLCPLSCHYAKKYPSSLATSHPPTRGTG